MEGNKRTVTILILFFLFLFPLTSSDGETPGLRGEFHFAPLLGTGTEAGHGYSLRTTWLMSRQKEKHLTGFRIGGDFSWFSPGDTAYTLAGPQFTLNLLLVHSYRVSQNIEISGEIGGLWQHSSFTQAGEPAFNYMGLTLNNRLNLSWPGWDFMHTEISGNFSLMDHGLFPAATNHFAISGEGEIKVYYHPPIPWLEFYLGSSTIYTNNTNVTGRIDTRFINFKAGVAFRFSFNHSRPPTPTPAPEAHPTPSPTVMPPEPETGFQVLMHGHPGDIAGFDGILFQDTTAELKPESLPLLDEIATVLKQTRRAVSIAAYALFSGNPGTDRDLHVARSRVIKNYLQKQGVPAENLQITAGAILLMTLEDNRHKVAFTLLPEKATSPKEPSH